MAAGENHPLWEGMFQLWFKFHKRGIALLPNGDSGRFSIFHYRTVANGVVRCMDIAYHDPKSGTRVLVGMEDGQVSWDKDNGVDFLLKAFQPK